MARIFSHPLKKLDLGAPLKAEPISRIDRDSYRDRKISILPVERFDHRNGLKSLQVHQAITSVDGRIWCATPAGLACYDGVNVYMFDRKHGLSSHGLRTINIHPDNTLWLGTDVGVEVLDITGLEPVAIWSANIGTVNCLDTSESRAVIGTSQGLFYWDGGQAVTRAEDTRVSRATISSILLKENGDVWLVGPRSGIVVLEKSKREYFNAEILKTIGQPTKLARGMDDQVIISGTQGLVCVDPGFECAASFRTDNRVDAILQYDGFIWVGSGNRLFRLQLIEGNLAMHDVVHDNVDARHLMSDEFDNIWISSGDQALLRLSAMRKTFTDSADSNIGSIMCVKRHEYGFYVGGSNGMIMRDNESALAGMAVWDVLDDNFGKIWLATNDGLYCRVNPHFTIPYRHEDCDVVAAECRVLVSFNGRIYVGSIRGLARLDPDGIQEVMDPNGESLGYVYSLHVGPNGRLWIATLGRGLFRIDENGIEVVKLSSMSEFGNAYALTHDKSGYVYLAHDNMISKIDAKDEVSILVDADVAIAAWTVKFLEPDLIIAGTSNGLIIYDSDSGDIRHKVSGNFDDVPWEFTTSRSLEITDGRKILCGLGSGLRRVDLDDLTQMARRPSAALAYAHWRGVTPIEEPDGIRVPVGRWHLELGLKTCWYLDECTMRTRLWGFDDVWSPSAPIGPINFTSLPEGDYHFEVEITSPLAGTGLINTVFEFFVRGMRA